MEVLVRYKFSLETPGNRVISSFNSLRLSSCLYNKYYHTYETTSLGSSHFPCGVCEARVGWDDRVLVCDPCNVWYHIDCQGMDSSMYEIYNQTLDRSLAWECFKCSMPNFSTSLFDTMGLIDTSNRFYSLSVPVLTLGHQWQRLPPLVYSILVLTQPWRLP